MKKIKIVVASLLLFIAICIFSDCFSLERRLFPFEVDNYQKYNIEIEKLSNMPEDSSNDTCYISVILYHITLEKEYRTNDILVKIYSSNGIEDFLPLCQQITDISMLNNSIYISYVAVDKNEITICIDDNGVNHLNIYKSSTNTFIYISDTDSYLITNFR